MHIYNSEQLTLLWPLQPKSSSWASQRALEAQVAMLRQQLDIAAATQMELQKEIDVRCDPSTLSRPCHKTLKALNVMVVLELIHLESRLKSPGLHF